MYCILMHVLFALCGGNFIVHLSLTDDPSGSSAEGEASGSRTAMETLEAGPSGKETESGRLADVEMEDREPESDEEMQGRELGDLPPHEEVIQGRGSGEPEEETHDYFARPKSVVLDSFFKYHPQQTPKRKLPNIFHTKNGINRKWLTYCEENHALFCTVCLAFTKPSAYDSSFVREGMKDWKHVHQRIEEHEKSHLHQHAAEAYFLRTHKGDIASQLGGNQLSQRQEQVRRKRQVMDRVVSVIKMIGRQGLSYRGSEFEAAYTLEDRSLNHGNFLEMILLLGMYDTCLQQHLTDSIKKSKAQHASGSKRRGSLVTLLSKETTSKVIRVIGQLIKESIASEVREAKLFSVQIDTTQDIAAKDQCSVIIRYVTDVVHERLVALLDCEASTGQYFVSLLKDTLAALNLDVSCCVGCATDGAANMQGSYKGFAALLSKEAPTQIHVWCYAHVLNLVLGDTTGSVIQSATLFNLLHDIAIFIKESYKRMRQWEETSTDRRHRRLSSIGQTRWWAKDAALTKVFGCFGNPDSALFVDVVLTLLAVQQDQTMKPSARAKVKGFIECLLKYETVLTAQTFLRIFEQTSPLSKYLQSSGMDLLTAHRLVVGTEDGLKKCVRDFSTVTEAADRFVEWANKELLDKEDCEIAVEVALPEKRLKKKKSKPGELAEDEPLKAAEKDFEVHVHNVILDTITQSIHERFAESGKLCSDFACLDPKNFSEVRDKGLPPSAMTNLSSYLMAFDDQATTGALQAQLTSLATHWERLKLSPLEEYKVRTSEEEPSEDTEEGEGSEKGDMEGPELSNVKCRMCKNCALCVYIILAQYNLLTDAYHILNLAYKFLLTLSTTQVACERSFSTLKFVKNRLRSTTGQEHLEAFMLMATEKGILMTLDNEKVIDKVAEKSELLKRQLMF